MRLSLSSGLDMWRLLDRIVGPQAVVDVGMRGVNAHSMM